MPRQNNKGYYNHDDRGHNIRKVSFMNGSGRIRKNNRPNHLVVKYVADHDVEMEGMDRKPWMGNNKHRKNFRERPDSPGIRNRRQPREWYQVKILYGTKYPKPYLLQLLAKYLSPKVFMPISYSNMGKDGVFYVEDSDIAMALRNANKKIALEDGYLMELKVREGIPPPVQINDKVKEQIKLVMAKRYIAENKALDLSKFAYAPEFQGNIFCPLSRPSIMRVVWQIISENISDLVAINLNHNKIAVMDDSSSVEIKKLKNLKILHLGGNKISSILTLNCFRDLELTELVLKDNPLVNVYKDNTHYVRYDSGVT